MVKKTSEQLDKKKEVLKKIEELVDNKISEIVENVKNKKKNKKDDSIVDPYITVAETKKIKSKKNNSLEDDSIVDPYLTVAETKKIKSKKNNSLQDESIVDPDLKVVETNNIKSDLDLTKKIKSKKDPSVQVAGSKKSKSKKDIDHPKKNKSAYNFYNMKQFAELKKEYPSYTSAEIMTKIASQWKELNDLDKEYYKNLALDDVERYKKEMENYTPNIEETKIKGPKRNLSGFNFYCKNILPKLKSEYKDLSQKDLMTKVGANWKSLEDKSEYEELAKKDQERYAKELLEFKN